MQYEKENQLRKLELVQCGGMTVGAYNREFGTRLVTDGDAIDLYNELQEEYREWQVKNWKRKVPAFRRTAKIGGAI